MQSYRGAFWIVLVINVLLMGALGLLWRRSRSEPATPTRVEPGPQRTAAASAPANPSADGSAVGPVPGSPAQTNTASAENSETPLLPVQLTPQRLQSIGVKTGVVERKPVHEEIRTVGNVEVDEQRLAYVQVRFPGWIQKVFADSTYQYLRKGQALFTIYSPDLVTTEQEYLLAKQNESLLAQSSVPGVASGATSLVNAAEERLKQWNVPAREIAQLESTGQVRHELEIDSPVSGYIIERNALPNMYVQPETKLYTVADLSTVWVYAQVFQTDIGRIKVGDPATVTVDSYPGRSFTGRADFIWPQVDVNTRTVKVRLVFPNAGMKLAPGMFVNVRLDVPMGRQTVIPASGVLQSGTRQIAFVDHGQGNLEPREVELGPRVGDDFIVLKGLKAGERVVTSANFLIDSESQLQAALGAFAPPPPGAGTASAMNAPSTQASVEFSTVPSPPRKGDNTFRVKLRESNGSPIAGAQVTVTFFMPAMPAMGMAALRVAFNLSEKGAGLYEGSGKLESGGTWQVSIGAQKNGQTLASKQLTVNAEGGM